MTALSKNPFWIVGIVILLVGLCLRLIGLQELELTFFDEGSYILESARMFGREPSTGFYYARPGFIFWLGLFRSLVPDPVLSARLIGPVSFVLLGILFLMPLRKLFSWTVAVVALAYLSVMGLHLYYSRLVFPDALVSALLFAGILFHVVAERERSFAKAVLSGIALGFVVVCGSYRTGPTLLALSPFVLAHVARSRNSGAWTRLGVSALSAIAVFLPFQVGFRFVQQVMGIIQASTLTRDKSVDKLDPDFLFFGFVLFVTTSAFWVLIGLLADRPWRSDRKALDSEPGASDRKYLLRLLWIVLLTPIVFHTFYYLRAPKVISTTLPGLAVLMAVGTLMIRSKPIRVATISIALLWGSVQTALNLTQMGLRDSRKFYEKLASYPGPVAYVDAVLIRASVPFDEKRTQIVLGWDCDWYPLSCDPNYKAILVDEYAKLPPAEKARWKLIDQKEFRLEPWMRVMDIMESFDSTPKKMSSELIQQALLGKTYSWVILENKRTSKDENKRAQ